MDRNSFRNRQIAFWICSVAKKWMDPRRVAYSAQGRPQTYYTLFQFNGCYLLNVLTICFTSNSNSSLIFLTHLLRTCYIYLVNGKVNWYSLFYLSLKFDLFCLFYSLLLLTIFFLFIYSFIYLFVCYYHYLS